VQLERSKREQAQLFKASRELGSALTDEEVLEAGLSAASGLARFDFAAITFFDTERRQHMVRIARGLGAEAVQGATFKDNHSLTAMVVKNKHYLPYKGELDPKQVLFTPRASLPAMRSALVLPLVVREGAIGTLTVAAERPHAFGDSVRSALQVLSNQLAIALSNARAVKRLEEMATTDGLTGCLNKRAFLEELESKIRSAQRFQKKLSLIVTDIDHFKSVNDTYGHATGDVVIKELGAILMRVKRETDRVARFGGEEFCVLCEETDTEGAVQLAERVREELGKTVFQTELGKLKVAASLGVATFPANASTSAGLFEITDKALYAAKHGGRNVGAGTLGVASPGRDAAEAAGATRCVSSDAHATLERPRRAKRMARRFRMPLGTSRACCWPQEPGVRPSGHVGTGDVRLQLVELVDQLRAERLGHVADREQPVELPLGDDGHVTAAAGGHELHRVAEMVVGRQREELGCHDVAHPRVVRVPARRHDPREDVALREDAHPHLSVAHQDRAHVVLVHHRHRVHDARIDLDAMHGLALLIEHLSDCSFHSDPRSRLP
jgi:diguanylate cyclase (GGDEF)-like protein